MFGGIKLWEWAIVLGMIFGGIVLYQLYFSHDLIGCGFRCGADNWGCINECQWWDVDTTMPYQYQNLWKR